MAPLVLRNLGVAQYGIWTVATAAVSTGSIIASGFGDANIQQVATERATGGSEGLLRAVRSTMGIHLVLGSVIAILAWGLAPYIADRMAVANVELRLECLWCMRIAGLLMFVRAIESVCISTQRAFERYGAAVRISILARLLSLVAAAVLTSMSRNVVSIMAATAILTVVGLGAQLIGLKGLLHIGKLTPSFDVKTTKALLRFGIFSWLLAVSGVLFSQADRLIGGASLGAAAVVSYALCAQIAQPVYGLTASGLHFLFPYLAGRRATETTAVLRKVVLCAFMANVSLILLGTSILLIFGNRILQVLAGDSVARSSTSLLPVVVASSAVLGLNVTGSYAMLALGRVQTVTWLNLAGGAAMMLLIAFFLPRYGLTAIATSRVVYGSVTLLVYVPLVLNLRPGLRNLKVGGSPFPAGEEA